MLEKIEILSLEIFETHKEEIQIVDCIRKDLKLEIGWHYHLDLAWILKEIKHLPKGSLILDAGAGRGLTQFLLAKTGYNVISVDYVYRSFSRRQKKMFGNVIYYLNDQSQSYDNPYIRHLNRVFKINSNLKSLGLIDKLIRFFKNKHKNNINMAESAVTIVDQNRYQPGSNHADCICDVSNIEEQGAIFIYKSDLKDMSLLPDGHVDAIVSVSALEHNNHEDLRKCIKEISRVTKPGGRLILTVNASQSEDWFHNPSKGWCYSEGTLKRLFELPEDIQSNYSEKDRLFNFLKTRNNELHKRLSPSYFKSGNNGMPWGNWDPKYQPVGIAKRNPM
jgi:SAM-dependent methyltransferase